jgi:tetratricopeptide (TPR) repeat protein
MLRFLVFLVLGLATGSLPAVATSGPDYAGSGVCAECHASETAQWLTSDHAWALKEPTADSMLGDFDAAQFTHKGVTSRFFRKDGGYFVETEGSSGKLETFQIRYAVGHRPLQQYLVETEKGRLQVLDLAWDVTAKKWFHLYPDENAPPGDGMHWTGSYKNWQARCAACHQTGFDKGYDFPTRTYQTHWKELTVGCESCHGPGSEHIDWARSSRSSDNPHQSLMPKLGPGQQENELNVCGPCHARRDAFSQLSPPAGSPFAEHYALSGLSPDLYFADGQQNAEVFILGSFLQSKMKAKGVTCSDCHDGHSGALVAEGNAVCTQCHSEAGNGGFPSLRKADYDTPAHHHHEPGSEAAQCVSCHMPERSYMVIDPRRDHFFRKPDPLQAKAAGAPDACTSCHTEKTAEWAAAAIKSWAPESDYSWQDRSAQIAFQSSPSEKTAADLVAYARNLDRPALVRASAVTALGALSAADAEVLLKDPDEGVRTAAAGALRALEPQQRIALLRPLLNDPSATVRQRAAVELSGAGVAALPPDEDILLRSGLQSFLDQRLANADMPESHMAIGGLALGRRQWPEAEAAFSAAVEMDPQLAPAWLMLVRLREARGDTAGTDAALTAAVAALPRNPDILLARAGFTLRQEKAQDAVAWYRRAIALDPQNADAWLGMSIAHYLLGDRDQAKDAAARARALSPGLQLPRELNELLSSPG